MNKQSYNLGILVLFSLVLVGIVIAAPSSSSNYDLDVYFSYSGGGNNASSSNYITGMVVGDISGDTSSGDYDNAVGFFEATLNLIPTIRLISPVDNTWTTDAFNIFNYTPRDDNLDNCSLWGNFSGTWKKNETNSSPNTRQQVQESLTLTNGTYIWNVLCYDTVGNFRFNETNYTIRVDTSIPFVTQVYPGDNTFYDLSSVGFNYTPSGLNLEACVLWGNFSGTWKKNETNATIVSNEFDIFTINFDEGNYLWNVICNNTASIEGVGTNLSFTIDNSNPRYWASATNAPAKINEQVYFWQNWTDNYELNGYIFSWNGSGSWENFTFTEFGGVQNESNITKIVNLTRGNVIGWRYHANDSAGLWNSTAVQVFTVVNSLPTFVNLSLPLNDTTIQNRNPFFNWSKAFDPDNDTITYDIIINERYCDSGTYPKDCVGTPISVTDLTENNYSDVSTLGIDAEYNWTVRPYDGYEYGNWSDEFNFTVEGVLAISITCTDCNDIVEFGSTYNTFSYNTTTDSPIPLIVQNDGNAFVDISVNATSFWGSEALNTRYYQLKAGNASEQNSFNWSNSTIDWQYMTTAQKLIIGDLNYSNQTDLAEIELLITVPENEESGKKETTITVEARYFD